ncbi:MAG TPA: hypothetical protein VF573_22305 [Paraburkholderia sp.]|uniref:hypothetical protein n=1 Tax=Paraburkholderia sp. TaxID=1926495 RepID=UPI002ED20F64
MKWPMERLERQRVADSDEDVLGLLRDVYGSFPARGSEVFESVVGQIIGAHAQDVDAQALLDRLARNLESVSDGTERGISSYAEHALLAFACVEALRRDASMNSWRVVVKLSCHSYSLEHVFPDVCIVAAQGEEEFKLRVVKLLDDVLLGASNSVPITSSSGRREQFQALRESWTANPALSNIWWGLRGSEPLRYTDSTAAFRVLSALDINVFLNALGRFDEPYTVDSALTAAGAAFKFSMWCALVQHAPSAFDERRAWNKSMVIPLLLVTARNQILFARNKVRPNSTELEAAEAKQEVDELVDAVVHQLRARPDCDSIVYRWAPWLMRQLVMAVSGTPTDDPNRITSNGYADSRIIEIIGEQSDESLWSHPYPADAEDWEPWCFQSLLTNYAFSGKCETPTVDAFLREWHLTPEDWQSTRGQALREHAALMTSLGDTVIPTYGAQLLAYPMVASDDAFEHWATLWRHTAVLRELIEFDDLSQVVEAWRGRYDAARLTMLAFSIGLSMLDSSSQGNGPIPVKQDLARTLCASLAIAAQEMLHIDRLNRSFWIAAVRQIAVRRLIWEKRESATAGSQSAMPFLSDTRPTFGDFLRAFSSDTVELLNLLLVALLNVPEEKVRQAMRDTSIDLNRELSIARELARSDSRRYPFSEEQLNKLAALSLGSQRPPQSGQVRSTGAA